LFSYREIPPSPALAPYVKCFWALRAKSDDPRTERILPDASFELVFHLGDPFPGQPSAIFIGEVRRPTVITPSRNADVFGVRFSPGGVAPFLRAPARAMRDAILPLRDVLDCEDQIIDSRSRVASMESVLLRRFRETRNHRLARVASSLIASRHGSLRVREVANIIGTTERSLERAFDDNVGIGVKEYSRLMRFQSFVRGESDEYFDDSQRIPDFHDFGGVTPAQFERERNEMNAAFVGNVQD